MIMNLSGVGLTGNAVEPGITPNIGVMEFRSLTTQEQSSLGVTIEAKDMPPLMIMFNAKGEVDRIYRLFPPASFNACPPWLAAYPPKRPQGTIYLFVGDDAVEDPLVNLADTSNLWITIDPKSGATSTAPNAVPSNLSLNSGIPAVVASSRQLAASGQSVGGR